MKKGACAIYCECAQIMNAHKHSIGGRLIHLQQMRVIAFVAPCFVHDISARLYDVGNRQMTLSVAIGFFVLIVIIAGSPLSVGPAKSSRDRRLNANSFPK